jgi:hypothetical protein
MLMVIIGAGASYDSSPDRPPQPHGGDAFRPPLANYLFQAGGLYSEIRNQIPEIKSLLPQLIPVPGRSLEESLQKLHGERSTNPDRDKQLAAVRYYLQMLFDSMIPKCLHERGGVTNYQALIEQI